MINNFDLYQHEHLECWEGGVDPPNLKSILFQQCTNIPNNIGNILHEDQFSLTKLQFDDCSFVNMYCMKEIVTSTTELALLRSITSFCFTSCSSDHVQQMCLVWCLQEERDNPDNLRIHVWQLILASLKESSPLKRFRHHSTILFAIRPFCLPFQHHRCYLVVACRGDTTTEWLHSLHACIWNFFLSTTHIIANS